MAFLATAASLGTARGPRRAPAGAYAWSVPAEAIVFVPGLVVGLNVATRAAAQLGDGALVQTPVYRPIMDAPGNAGRCCSRWR